MPNTSLSRVSPASLLTVVGLITMALCASAPLAHTQRAAQAPARTEDELRQLYRGAWFLQPPEDQARRIIDRAITRAVSEMNYFVQGIAESQLRDNTPINRRLDIGFEPDGRITVSFDQRYTYTTRPRATQAFPLPDGGTDDVTQLFRDGHLEQVFSATLGRRWNVFSLSADGASMTMSATQQGPLMPAPMNYRLEYRKQP